MWLQIVKAVFPPPLRHFFLSARAVLIGAIKPYWGLRQMKWRLRALVGLQARPRTKNLLGQWKHTAEGVEPIQGQGPAKDEPKPLLFRFFEWLEARKHDES